MYNTTGIAQFFLSVKNYCPFFQIMSTVMPAQSIRVYIHAL